MPRWTIAVPTRSSPFTRSVAGKRIDDRVRQSPRRLLTEQARALGGEHERAHGHGSEVPATRPAVRSRATAGRLEAIVLDRPSSAGGRDRRINWLGFRRPLLTKEDAQDDQGSDRHELALPVLEGLEPELRRREVGRSPRPRCHRDSFVFRIPGRTGVHMKGERHEEQPEQRQRQRVRVDLCSDATSADRPAAHHAARGPDPGRPPRDPGSISTQGNPSGEARPSGSRRDPSAGTRFPSSRRQLRRNETSSGRRAMTRHPIRGLAGRRCQTDHPETTWPVKASTKSKVMTRVRLLSRMNRGMSRLRGTARVARTVAAQTDHAPARQSLEVGAARRWHLNTER